MLSEMKKSNIAALTQKVVKREMRAMRREKKWLSHRQALIAEADLDKAFKVY